MSIARLALPCRRTWLAVPLCCLLLGSPWGSRAAAEETAAPAEGAAPVEAAAPAQAPALLLPARHPGLDARAFHAINLKPGHHDALDPLFEGLMPLGDRSAIAVPVGLYAWGRLSDDWKLRRVGIYTAAAMASSALATEGLKGLVARDRPVQRLGESSVRVVGKRMADGRSFPSGHASNAFAWATVLADLYPDQAVLCFGLATAIGFGRVRIGAHYPSDVLAGAAIGYAAGRLVLSNRDLLLRREEPAAAFSTLGVAHQFRF